MGSRKHFHHFPGNQVSAFLGDLALLVVEAALWAANEFVAADHGFPIQPIRSSNNFFGGFALRFTLAEVQSRALTSSISGFWQVFIIGDDDGGMPPFFAERKHERCPIVSRRSFLFKVFGRANHRGFGPADCPLEFPPAVGVGEIVRRTDGDRLDFQGLPAK